MAQFLKKSHMRQGKRLRSIEQKRKREREGETLAKEKIMKKELKMIERKTTIKKIQKILNEHYNYYVFGKGRETMLEDDDEKVDDFINLMSILQDNFDELYEEWGYKYKASYEDEPLEIEKD